MRVHKCLHRYAPKTQDQFGHEICIKSDSMTCWLPVDTLLYISAIVCGCRYIFNPRRMREGYGSRFVCVCVCVCVTELAATYLVYSLKVRCH